MQIKDEQQNGVAIVVIDDHLDTMSAPILEKHLLGLIDGGERRVVMDLTDLDYVNSAGLKVLLVAAKKLEAFGGSFALFGLRPAVAMVFEMIGFNRIMKIVEQRADALQAVAGPA